MKKCIACNKELKLNNFSGDKSRKDGFHSKCKVCVRKYAKDLRIKNGWVKKQKKIVFVKKNGIESIEKTE